MDSRHPGVPNKCDILSPVHYVALPPTWIHCVRAKSLADCNCHWIGIINLRIVLFIHGCCSSTCTYSICRLLICRSPRNLWLSGRKQFLLRPSVIIFWRFQYRHVTSYIVNLRHLLFVVWEITQMCFVLWTEQKFYSILQVPTQFLYSIRCSLLAGTFELENVEVRKYTYRLTNSSTSNKSTN
jgi:hypothetical protein